MFCFVSANRVTNNLVNLAKQAHPSDVVSTQAVRAAMGITSYPVSRDMSQDIGNYGSGLGVDHSSTSGRAVVDEIITCEDDDSEDDDSGDNNENDDDDSLNEGIDSEDEEQEKGGRNMRTSDQHLFDIGSD